MLWVSEILIGDHGLASFDDLLTAIRDRARAGELFLRIDVKPPFADTPPDWESRIEAAFTGIVDES